MPASKSRTTQDELSQIAEWEQANNLQLNKAKLKEMVYIANHKKPALPDPIQGFGWV